jgi:hypothetical protein
MTYYKDLSDYVYHRAEFGRPNTKNIGWLGRGHDFKKMDPTEEILDPLWSYCRVSVAQMRGVHECEFCSRPSSGIVERKGERLLLGTSEIRVFSREGDIYAAPTLIFHYVETHRYRPPDEFLRALVREPAPPSKEYFDRLAELGLEWNKTFSPPALLKRFRFDRSANEGGE